ncbi:TPA: hypothetical protein QDC04_006611 [Burkholderia stabilis]|nr:hypothetical protein [Burkholderia stabilis]HDR9526059.1 hypothetical protein [Burkholderia stabilis]HDR9533274.1 hypothetical protein [Burkholderia stabilis]HDR9542050.1 hypothetical protein [Burkholderia stabilis]HDR9549585.1 hypothetical protein [Burkholderia stabilis]
MGGINRAADMLTMQFGPMRQTTTRKGTLKWVGAWALHIQCNWQLRRENDIVATQDDLRGSDDEARTTVARLDVLLIKHGQTTVERALGGESGQAWITLSAGMSLVIMPNGMADEEDWRLFEPSVDSPHFVIEGGRIAPDSLA